MEDLTGEQQMAQPAPAEKKTRPKWQLFFLGVGCIVLLGIIGGGGYLYQKFRQLSEEPLVLRAADRFSIAVARVNGEDVRYRDYILEKKTLRTFYSQNPQLLQRVGLTTVSEEQISDQVLSRLAVNTLLNQFARKNNLLVSAAEISEAKKKIFAPFPSEADAEKQLQATYGWNIAMYEERVIRPTLVQQKIDQFLNESVGDEWKAYDVEQAEARHILFRVKDGTSAADEEQIKKQAEATLARLKRGAKFDAVSAELTAKEKNAADPMVISEHLDWFGRGVMAAPFESAVFSAPTGKLIEQPVRTQFGYHLIWVDGKRTVRSVDRLVGTELRSARIEFLLPVHDPFLALVRPTSTPDGVAAGK